jgi:hypothetical protein
VDDLSSDPADRWIRVGRSTAPDPATAGAEAAAAALGSDPTAQLLLVFCSSSYDTAALLDGVCSVTPNRVPIVGGTTFGELASPEPGATPSEPDSTHLGFQPGVVVTALGGAGFTANSLVVEGASVGRRESGAAAAAAMAGIEAPHQVLIMLADGLTREQHELVRGAYSVLGLDVPIVGGCSADNLDYALTYQFHGTGAQVHRYVDSLVAVGLGSTGPIGIGIAHGWSKQGQPMVVTSSSDGEVFRLDDEPALDVYLRRIGADPSILDDPGKFREMAFQHPLGMSRRSGEDIRVVHAVNADTGSLLCLADVPQGGMVWTMSTTTESLIQAASDSCEMSIQGLAGVAPRGLVVFDCGARKLKLGEENLPAEQDAITRAAAGAPFSGFYTFGEFGRTHGSRGMHHLTIVTLALA